MQIVEDRALVVQTKYPNTITSRIKNSTVVEKNGDIYDVAVKWGFNEARALAALIGSDVPSPIKRDYKWTGKLKPFAHQRETASFFTLYDRAFCFNEQGTGKTASAIWAADYLMKLGLVKRVLVLCPLSIMKSAWQQDLFKFAMHRSCSVAYGDAKARKKILAAKAEFVILNFDGLAVVKDEVMAGGFDLIVVDEASAYKNAQTTRWKILRDVAATVPRLWMMTGTPAAQSPLDAYGLAKLVNPDGVPKYFGQFRDSVMYKVTQFKWQAKPAADAIVHAALQPAIRFEKAQCLDLPPVTHVDREAPLTAQQMKYYRLLKQELLLEASGESVTAVNAAVKINKLLQISSGAVYSDSGAVVEFDVDQSLHAAKILAEIAQRVGRPGWVVVEITKDLNRGDKATGTRNIPAVAQTLGDLGAKSVNDAGVISLDDTVGRHDDREGFAFHARVLGLDFVGAAPLVRLGHEADGFTPRDAAQARDSKRQPNGSLGQRQAELSGW
jgi:hypothetical protein